MEEKRGFEYRSLFWPILLIGVGVIWLLVSLGILAEESLWTILRMWPLILVVIGLDIIFGRRSPIIGAIIGLAAIALVIALALMAPSLDIGPSGELKTLTFSEPVESATSARVNLDLERYRTTIGTVSDSSMLFEAELDTVTDVAFSASGTRNKSITIDPRGDYSLLDDTWVNTVARNARWEIGLSPDVPLDLTVDVGSGGAVLELMDLDLSDFILDGGSGSTDLALPASASQYDVEIDGGSGSFAIELEAGADIQANFNVGSGSFNFVIGSGADVELSIDGGSGSITIDVPNNVGVRVVVTERGSGGVRLPNSYRLVDDRGDNDRDTGIWESEGFGSVAHQVEIEFDPGSGSMTVR
jgi:hypothetical protein